MNLVYVFDVVWCTALRFALRDARACVGCGLTAELTHPLPLLPSSPSPRRRRKCEHAHKPQPPTSQPSNFQMEVYRYLSSIPNVINSDTVSVFS